MISFNEVTKIYPPNITAINNVTFSIGKGEFVSVAGRSGAGKTTLLRLIIADEKPTAGQVFFEGLPVHELSSDSVPLLRRKIGVIFQDYKLIPSFTLAENISYVLQVLGVPEAQIAVEVQQVLSLVGLEAHAHKFPYQLSGGEHQRGAIARAIVHRPQVLLADEPTGNLDPYCTKDIVNLLLRMNEMGTTVILASHDKDIINSLNRRVITLEEGRVIRDEERGKFIL